MAGAVHGSGLRPSRRYGSVACRPPRSLFPALFLLTWLTLRHLRRRANLNKAPRQLLLSLDSPEPTEMLISLDLGLQWALEDYPPVPRRVGAGQRAGRQQRGA